MQATIRTFQMHKYFAEQSGIDVEKPLIAKLSDENKSLKKPLTNVRAELAEIPKISLYVVGSQAPRSKMCFNAS